MHYVVQLTYDALMCSAIGRLLGQPLALLRQVPERPSNQQVTLAAWILESTPLDREAQIVLEHLRDKAAQVDWEGRSLAEDSHRLLALAPGDILGEIDGADPDRLAALTQVLGRAADRAVLAMPKAVRRVQRAQRIGLCD